MEWRLESIVVPRTNALPLSLSQSFLEKNRHDTRHTTIMTRQDSSISQIGYMNKLFDYVSDSAYFSFLLFVQIFYRSSFTVANLKLVNYHKQENVANVRYWSLTVAIKVYSLNI